MIKKFGVTLTLVVERDMTEGEDEKLVMDSLADDLTQALSEYDVGMASVFPIPDEPEPHDAAIIPFPGKRKN